MRSSSVSSEELSLELSPRYERSTGVSAVRLGLCGATLCCARAAPSGGEMLPSAADAPQLHPAYHEEGGMRAATEMLQASTHLHMPPGQNQAHACWHSRINKLDAPFNCGIHCDVNFWFVRSRRIAN